MRDKMAGEVDKMEKMKNQYSLNLKFSLICIYIYCTRSISSREAARERVTKFQDGVQFLGAIYGVIDVTCVYR